MAIVDDGVGASLTDRQRLAWLRLTRSENVGPVTFHKLLQRFGSAETALEQLPELSLRGGAAKTLRICPVDEAERELELAERLGLQLVALSEPDYPAALRMIDAAPPILTMRGNPHILERPSVAIVGSRNASAVGHKMARTLATGIGQAGFSITSGLARGIDAAAHDAAIATGTIAVLAGGMDRPYPPQNIPLLDDICASRNGIAVSEMPLGWEPRARDFLRRNRIIAGISLGLVVVEAAKRSGSLISARLAGQFGRLVFAVPGSPLDPRAYGTNDLIKEGALLTSEPQDVVDAMTPLAGTTSIPTQLPLQLEEEQDVSSDAPPPTQSGRVQVVEALGPSPIEIDYLVRLTQLSPAEVYMVLLELDLAGRLARHPGGLVSMIPLQHA